MPVNTEVGLSYLKINQNHYFEKGHIKFSMDALSIHYTKWYENIGFKFLIGKSRNTDNSVNLDKKYNNEIDQLLSFEILYKYEIYENISLISGLGVIDYKTTWEVDGLNPDGWTNDTDHDISYYLGVKYSLSNKSSIELGYTDYYRKNKVDFGKEKTEGYNVSFIYKF